MTRQSKEIVKETGRREEKRLLDHARQLANELAARPAAAGMPEQAVLATWRQREGFELGALVRATPSRPSDVSEPADSLGVASGRVARRRVSDRSPHGRPPPCSIRCRSNRACSFRRGAPGYRPSERAAAVGAVLQSDLKERLDAIEAAERAYLEIRRDRRELPDSITR